MRRLNTVAAIVLVGMFCTGSASDSGEPGPISVTLSSPKTEYTFGETIMVNVAMTNRSESTRTLSLGPASGHGPYGLRILQGDEGLPIAEASVNYMTSGLLVLRPKETVSFLYPGLYLRPGEHTIRVQYELGPAMIDPFQNTPSSVWTGKVTSNTVRLVVREDPLTPELQADFDQRMRRLVAAMQDTSPELRRHLAWYLCNYMPLTREYLRGMLSDRDYYVRGSAVSVICQLANPTGTAIPERKDVSLLPELLDMLESETIPVVKSTAAAALGWAAPAMDEEQKAKAAAMLSIYVEQQAGESAAWAATSLLKVDPQQALPAIRKKLARGGERDRQFMNLLQQALKKHTGTSDVTEALRRIEEGADQPLPAAPAAPAPSKQPKEPPPTVEPKE